MRLLPAHDALDRDAVPDLDPGDITIGVNGSAVTYVLKGERYVEGGAHAIDPTDGVLTPKITVNGTVDTATPGDYEIQYVVRDSQGHVAAATRTVKVVESMDKQSGGVPVLMYHYVYDPANPPDDLNANFIPTTSLEQQFRYLTEHRFYFPSWAEVRAFLDGTHSLPARSIVLSFDDGEPRFFQYGQPLIDKYRVPVTSFVIGNDGNMLQRMKDYASPYLEYESHSFDMHRAGGTIGHGGRISAMTKDEIVDDLKRSEQMTGSAQAFAYPFGDTTPDAQAAVAEAGFPLAFTTQYGWAMIGDDPTLLPRVRIQGDGSLESFIAAIQ
ncbi:polysaccharide deacetylase family protein [Bifidobacterium aerophilum]|uniref:polysaccharide deacetylase family protein n=1 Tax=Bifidobacterium aerophilum TaxID=1798155 RepID=UPI001EF9B03D|nr:polysaccharide deacetylase family protein [Bifidobacterium aerophilum]